jgi:broad specificity phosphatase PhoE
MAQGGQRIFLIRHGETEWSKNGNHTGRTDLPLTERGVEQAVRLKEILDDFKFSMVLTSPLLRARKTAELAGFEDALPEPNVMEWDYGIFEGKKTLEMRAEIPDWSIWKAEISGGESLEQVAERAYQVIERITRGEGDVAIFTHGHFSRIFAACWLRQPPILGRSLALDTASVSVLGYERATRVIQRWNIF